MKTFSLLFCLFVAISSSIANFAKIDPQLLSQPSSNIFISFAQGTSKILSTITQKTYRNQTEKIADLRSSLIQNSKSSHQRVVSFLHSNRVSYKVFWVSNQIYIQNAPLSLIEKLASFSEVSEITKEEILKIQNPLHSTVDNLKSQNRFMLEWGVEKIRANLAWELIGGNNGAGVRVGIMSGVRVTHEAILNNYVGENGWYDPYFGTEEPNDETIVGTHVTGTICGKDGIGVAPGSKWLACKACDTFSCSTSSILSCGEFMVCPTDPTGSNPDCSKHAHVVSNFWGGGNIAFDLMITAWITAGIVPVAANGNSGPSCGTAGSPGDNKDFIAVGSTTIDDILYKSSSRGPSGFDTIKPDITGPGQNIRSASSSADDAYVLLSGSSTSQAHVVGVVALLKGADPNLSVERVMKYLGEGASHDVVPTGVDCGGISETIFPNNAYGHGRADALSSLKLLLNDL